MQWPEKIVFGDPHDRGCCGHCSFSFGIFLRKGSLLRISCKQISRKNLTNRDTLNPKPSKTYGSHLISRPNIGYKKSHQLWSPKNM